MHHQFCGQREVHVYAQPFAVKVIQHVQGTDAATISKLICHEVHKPSMIGWVWHRQCVRFVPFYRFFGFIRRFSSSAQ